MPPRPQDGELKPGRYVAIGIADTGTGMTPEIAARVIETASRVRLAFAAACPEADLFCSLPAALLMASGP